MPDNNLQDPRNPRSPYNRYNPDSPFSVTNPTSPHYDPESGLASVLAWPMLIVIGLIWKVVLVFMPKESNGWTTSGGLIISMVIMFFFTSVIISAVSRAFTRK